MMALKIKTTELLLKGINHLEGNLVDSFSLPGLEQHEVNYLITSLSHYKVRVGKIRNEHNTHELIISKKINQRKYQNA